MSVLVVVADSAKARFFTSSQLKSDWKEIVDLSHSSARLKGRDLESDAPGRSFDSGGQGRHAMGKQVELKKQHQQKFSHELMGVIDKIVDANQIKKIYLIAAPQFLGELRRALPDRLQSMVAAEVAKDLVKQDMSNIRHQLM